MKPIKSIMLGASLLALVACQGQTNSPSENTQTASTTTAETQDVNVELNAWFANFDNGTICPSPFIWKN